MLEFQSTLKEKHDEQTRLKTASIKSDKISLTNRTKYSKDTVTSSIVSKTKRPK